MSLPVNSARPLPELRARCAALDIPLELAQVRRLQAYMELLLVQQGQINLTGIKDPAQAERLLLLESIAAVTAAPKLRTTPTGGATLRLLDVGAGGGIPGIPLAIAFPHLAVTLLEATRKKVDFLQHAIASLALEKVTALWGRAEDLAHAALHREQYDVVTVRSVGSLATVAELALPFCKRNGMLVAFKSLPLNTELQAASHAIHLLGGRDPRVTPFNLPELPAPHCVVTVTKSARTPQQYPRRDGRPAKRPLSKSSSAGISRTKRGS